MTKFTLKIETDNLSDLHAYSNAIETRQAIASCVGYLQRFSDEHSDQSEFLPLFVVLKQLRLALEMAGG
jgi:hypothetical protein